jgi:hypothetical protein
MKKNTEGGLCALASASAAAAAAHIDKIYSALFNFAAWRKQKQAARGWFIHKDASIPNKCLCVLCCARDKTPAARSAPPTALEKTIREMNKLLADSPSKTHTHIYTHARREEKFCFF